MTNIINPPAGQRVSLEFLMDFEIAGVTDGFWRVSSINVRTQLINPDQVAGTEEV